MKKITRRYWALHDCGLRNGSFVRSRDGITMAQWMNGDFMGTIEALPNGFKEVPSDHAEKLIPAVCW